MMPSFQIAGRTVGAGAPPMMVAELSGNHNGQLSRALELVDAAKAAGAHAVKLQTYTADTITLDHDGPGFRISGGLWDGRTLHDLYQEAHTPWDWHPAIFERARVHDMLAFSSPFDATAVDFLEALDCPAYKIASFEIVDLPLIRKAAATGKPLIMSTGMADLEDIRLAVDTARDAGCDALMLLHCISSYPAPAADSNLLTLPDLARRFDLPTGLSDHTHGTAVSVAAVSLGAGLIEKHFTLARSDGGPDAAFSLEPAEFTALVQDCLTAHSALGHADYGLKACERANTTYRRSLYFVAEVAAGETIGAADVRSIRPGHGLAPRHLDAVIGRRTAVTCPRGTPVAWDLLETV